MGGGAFRSTSLELPESVHAASACAASDLSCLQDCECAGRHRLRSRCKVPLAVPRNRLVCVTESTPQARASSRNSHNCRPGRARWAASRLTRPCGSEAKARIPSSVRRRRGATIYLGPTRDLRVVCTRGEWQTPGLRRRLSNVDHQLIERLARLANDVCLGSDERNAGR
jgi:hypothetical protein